MKKSVSAPLGALARRLQSIHDMKKPTKRPPSRQLEGEGSYTATRGYNAGLAEHMKEADIRGLAEKAAKALEGEEGAELRKAERAAKRGPKGLRASR